MGTIVVWDNSGFLLYKADIRIKAEKIYVFNIYAYKEIKLVHCLSTRQNSKWHYSTDSFRLSDANRIHLLKTSHLLDMRQPLSS